MYSVYLKYCTCYTHELHKHAQSQSVCVCVCAHTHVCVCVCMCVCVFVYACVYVCVCERERERETESVCVWERERETNIYKITMYTERKYLPIIHWFQNGLITLHIHNNFCTQVKFCTERGKSINNTSIYVYLLTRATKNKVLVLHILSSKSPRV